ncbi:hypothetical protein [Prochlorococcus sp. MIT 1223]|uniref:hypothetical protein n=1 Tax=Prochlorococcus sp. MIT 1223 TaxID=3096217 RepID=UPI002A747C88|nr:hypothetical protein [Prochlorococcus sp. MIT 1223]
MEIRPGTIPLATLSIVFAGLQVWWIANMLQNGRVAKNTTHTRKNQLTYQKQRLDKLLKK